MLAGALVHPGKHEQHHTDEDERVHRVLEPLVYRPFENEDFIFEADEFNAAVTEPFIFIHKLAKTPVLLT